MEIGDSCETPDRPRGIGAGEGASGLILKSAHPENLESPFHALNGFITPNDRFFVRNHFALPDLNVEEWGLRIEGAVRRQLTVRYRDLLAMPAVTIPATLECAGNGRASLNPPVTGLQWGDGAVSTAEWTGVRLSDVLEQSELLPVSRDVVLEGADQGQPTDPPAPGVIHYARSIPVEKAIDERVLLCYRMNGEPLPPAHGFPVRAIVPGWYGMASVKWLTRIVVLDRTFRGYYQTLDYTYFDKTDGLDEVRPLAEMQIKAQIARPVAGERIPPGSRYRVFGAAWSGVGEVRAVEFSADAGRSWNQTKWSGSVGSASWRLWAYDWDVPSTPGKAILMARAIGSNGAIQPMEHHPNRGKYMISHVQPVRVEIG